MLMKSILLTASNFLSINLIWNCWSFCSSPSRTPYFLSFINFKKNMHFSRFVILYPEFFLCICCYHRSSGAIHLRGRCRVGGPMSLPRRPFKNVSVVSRLGKCMLSRIRSTSFCPARFYGTAVLFLFRERRGEMKRTSLKLERK
jgi:hypothetical protein